MKLALGNQRTKIVESTDDERRWIYDFLSYKYKIGRGKDMVSSLLTETGTFGTGLVSVVKRGAADHGIPIELLDMRARPCLASSPDLSWLRPHQADALEAAKTHQRGIFWHATGAGKSALAFAIMQTYRTRWLVLAPGVDVLHQLQKGHLRFTNEHASVCGDGEFNTDARVLIATSETLSLDLDKPSNQRRFPWKEIRGVIVDECRGVVAHDVQRVCNTLTNCYWWFGLDATPWGRSDGQRLRIMALLGPVIHRFDHVAAEAAGVVARPRVKMIEHRVPHTSGDWHEVYRELVVTDKQRNERVVRAVLSSRKPCLVFVQDVLNGHAEHLAKLIAARGLSVGYITGAQSDQERGAIEQAFRAGNLEVVVASPVWNQGVDLPLIQSIVNAAGRKAVAETIQRAGRGSRRFSETGALVKDEFEVWDFFDSSGCMAHMGCRAMETHARRRRQAYMEAGFSVETVRL